MIYPSEIAAQSKRYLNTLGHERQLQQRMKQSRCLDLERAYNREYWHTNTERTILKHMIRDLMQGKPLGTRSDYYNRIWKYKLK